MNYLFLAAGLFLIATGVALTKHRGKKALKIMGDLCAATIADGGGTTLWLRKNFILCGGALTAVSLGGIALGRSMSFYAVLALFVFAVHMWLVVNDHGDNEK